MGRVKQTLSACYAVDTSLDYSLVSAIVSLDDEGLPTLSQILQNELVSCSRFPFKVSYSVLQTNDYGRDIRVISLVAYTGLFYCECLQNRSTSIQSSLKHPCTTCYVCKVYVCNVRFIDNRFRTTLCCSDQKAERDVTITTSILVCHIYNI
jgi:hypothetical protein